MQIFCTNRIIFECLGIFDSNDSQVKLVYYTCLVSPILLLLPSVAYSVANISDVNKATSAFYITCVLTMTHLKYMAFLHHKSLIRSVLDDFESIIKSSEWPNGRDSPMNILMQTLPQQAWSNMAFIELFATKRKIWHRVLCLYISQRSQCRCLLQLLLWSFTSWMGRIRRTFGLCPQVYCKMIT